MELCISKCLKSFLKKCIKVQYFEYIFTVFNKQAKLNECLNFKKKVRKKDNNEN